MRDFIDPHDDAGMPATAMKSAASWRPNLNWQAATFCHGILCCASLAVVIDLVVSQLKVLRY
jgi:hypothetical protein